MKKNKPYGETLKERIKASLKDCMYFFLLSENRLRGVLLHATRMISEMRANHGLGLLETMVLGNAYMAAALMSASLKGNDLLSLQVTCTGPIKGLVVEANAFGEVRGYLKNVPIPIDKPLESFDLSPFFGTGVISVTKYLEDAKQPFSGQVEIIHGSLAKDLANYYDKSEQIRTAFMLSIAPNEQGEVTGAGGMFLQVLPGTEDQMLKTLETRLQHLPSLGHLVQEESFPQSLLNTYFSEFNPRLLDHRGVEFMCHCSRKKIQNMLRMLDIQELEDMAVNGPFPVRILCHHCSTTYEFSQRQLQAQYRNRSLLSDKKTF